MPISSLSRARLFIRLQVLVGELLMRLERRVGVFPKMEAERADSTHHGHDEPHHYPDRGGHVLGGLGTRRGKTLRTGKGLADRRRQKNCDRQNDSRLHVMMRSRFIFRQKQMPKVTNARAATNAQMAPMRNAGAPWMESTQ